jgi:hypothetical protein
MYSRLGLSKREYPYKGTLIPFFRIRVLSAHTGKKRRENIYDYNYIIKTALAV